MIAAGSTIGFALVFVATTWSISLVLGAALQRSRRTLRAHGPRTERRAAALALVLPPAFGAAMALSLAGRSLAATYLGADHCATHGHHLHLCLIHGHAWAGRTWALASVAAIGAVVAVRLSQRGHALWRARRRLWTVSRLSSEVRLPDGGTIVQAPSRRPFCFVAGLWRPRIYVATSTWELLDPAERRAVLEHERAHVRQGDTWRGPALSALAVLGAPLVATAALQTWRRATERLCDRVAADRTGDAGSVASALVSLSRHAPAAAPSFAAPRDELGDRVRAVLQERHHGTETARRLGRSSAATSAVLVIAAIVGADPLHHAFETLLGSL